MHSFEVLVKILYALHWIIINFQQMKAFLLSQLNESIPKDDMGLAKLGKIPLL